MAQLKPEVKEVLKEQAVLKELVKALVVNTNVKLNKDLLQLLNLHNLALNPEAKEANKEVNQALKVLNLEANLVNKVVNQALNPEANLVNKEVNLVNKEVNLVKVLKEVNKEVIQKIKSLMKSLLLKFSNQKDLATLLKQNLLRLPHLQLIVEL